MSGPPTYRVVTLGCRVNKADSMRLERQLSEAGYRRAGERDDPDIWIVNTCAVTSEGMKKSRKAVRRCAAGGSRVYVTGCGVDFDPSPFQVPGVEGVFPNASKEELVSLVGSSDHPGGAPERGTAEELVRVPVKAQDGCSRRCAYCVVPYLRSEPCSRPMEEVVKEVRDRVAEGAGEVILCGIDLGSYRDPDTGGDLARLAGRIYEGAAPTWVRLSSIDISDVTDGLLELMGEEEGLCPHLHLPLQSGDEGVLRDMSRTYTPQGFLDRLAEIRALVPDLSLTTDVLVGFPTEDDEAFERTIGTLAAMEVSRAHVFKYSPRQGSPAWELGDPVPAVVKRERASRVRELASRSALRFQEGLVGRIIPVLVEGAMPGKPGKVFARTRWFTGMVTDGGAALTGEVVRAEAAGISGGLLRGRVRNARPGGREVG